MSWEDLDKELSPRLYKLWNRLTSGSYFPKPVKEAEIRKKAGGEMHGRHCPKTLAVAWSTSFHTD